MKVVAEFAFVALVCMIVSLFFALGIYCSWILMFVLINNAPDNAWVHITYITLIIASLLMWLHSNDTLGAKRPRKPSGKK